MSRFWTGCATVRAPTPGIRISSGTLIELSNTVRQCLTWPCSRNSSPWSEAKTTIESSIRPEERSDESSSASCSSKKAISSS